MDDEAGGDDLRSSNFFGWHLQGGPPPRVLVRGQGSTVWDDRGNALLDFASQLVAVNLGYGNRAVSGAVARQARQLPYVAPGFATPARHELSRALREVLPNGLDRYFFSPSGTEANEAAIRLARTVTGRPGIVALSPSYHGSTSASLSVSSDLRRGAAGPSSEVPGSSFVPACDCYHCPLALRYPSCGVACADLVGEAIDRAGDVAALIAEPVIGTNGVIVPVPEYWPKVRRITNDRGVLWIADEVMTGWGRTGAWFAVDRYHVVPDLLTTAKGITSGYVPLGLTATRGTLHEAFADRLLPFGHTYEAHPVALAAAAAAISEYRRLSLVEKARRDGDYLLDRLRRMASDHPSVGEVRGLGLFAAVELVKDRSERTPFNTPDDQRAGRPLVAAEVAEAMSEDGVYVLAWTSHLVIAPPLVVTREEIDRGIEALDRALRISDARGRGTEPPARPRVGASRRGARRARRLGPRRNRPAATAPAPEAQRGPRAGRRGPTVRVDGTGQI